MGRFRTLPLERAYGTPSRGSIVVMVSSVARLADADKVLVRLGWRGEGEYHRLARTVAYKPSQIRETAQTRVEVDERNRRASKLRGRYETHSEAEE